MGWHSKNIIDLSTTAQCNATFPATYNSSTYELTFSNASSFSGNSYSAVQVQTFNSGTYNTTIIGALRNGTAYASFTKSGTTQNAFRIKANGNKTDCGYFFTLDNLPDGEYTISLNVKSSTANTTGPYAYENFVVNRIQLEYGGDFTQFESPRTITSSTQNTTVGNHTLRATWAVNTYTLTLYDNKNILYNGGLSTQADLGAWSNVYDSGTNGVSITTKDGNKCAHITGVKDETQWIGQSVFERIKFGTEYIVSLAFKSTNYSAGTTNPYVAIYTSGYYDKNGSSTWFNLGLNREDLPSYSNNGWVDIFYHATSNSTVTSSTVTSVWAHIYTRDFTGDLYFRDYSIAEATNTTRVVAYDGATAAVTRPSQAGFSFAGYFTQPVGGTKVFNADGSVVKNLSGYTDSSGNWKHSSDLKLYAQWTENVSYLSSDWMDRIYGYSSVSAKSDDIGTDKPILGIPSYAWLESLIFTKDISKTTGLNNSMSVGTNNSNSSAPFVQQDGVCDVTAYYDNFYNIVIYSPGRIFAPQHIQLSNSYDIFSSLSTITFDNFDTSKVTDMSYMFYHFDSLTSVNVSTFDTSNVTSMYYMFHYCTSLTSIDVSSFDTSNVTDMPYMFYNCSALTSLNLGNFNLQSCTGFRFMLDDCSALSEIILPYNLQSGYTIDLPSLASGKWWGDASKGSSVSNRWTKVRALSDSDPQAIGCSTASNKVKVKVFSGPAAP